MNKSGKQNRTVLSTLCCSEVSPVLHEPVEFGEGFWECGNPVVLLTFLSDWVLISEDKFAGYPARVFPHRKGSYEEL